MTLVHKEGIMRKASPTVTWQQCWKIHHVNSGNSPDRAWWRVDRHSLTAWQLESESSYYYPYYSAQPLHVCSKVGSSNIPSRKKALRYSILLNWAPGTIWTGWEGSSGAPPSIHQYETATICLVHYKVSPFAHVFLLFLFLESTCHISLLVKSRSVVAFVSSEEK